MGYSSTDDSHVGAATVATDTPAFAAFRPNVNLNPNHVRVARPRRSLTATPANARYSFRSNRAGRARTVARKPA